MERGRKWKNNIKHHQTGLTRQELTRAPTVAAAASAAAVPVAAAAAAAAASAAAAAAQCYRLATQAASAMVTFQHQTIPWSKFELIVCDYKSHNIEPIQANRGICLLHTHPSRTTKVFGKAVKTGEKPTGDSTCCWSAIKLLLFWLYSYIGELAIHLLLPISHIGYLHDLDRPPPSTMPWTIPRAHESNQGMVDGMVTNH